MTHLRGFLFALPVLLAAGPCFAAPAPLLTEQDAIRHALDRHPSVEAARAALTAAQGVAAEADFLLPDNPAVTVDYTTDRLSGNRGEREWNAEISVPFWIAGQRGARQAFASAKTMEATGDIEQVLWSLVTAVREAYWRTWDAGKALDAARERKERSQDLVAVARQQVRALEISEIEQHQIEAEALADNRLEAQRNGEYLTALAVLAELTAGVQEQTVVLEDPRPGPPPAGIGDQTLERRRPDLIALRRKIETAHRDMELQQRNAWPNPELTLGFTKASSDYGNNYESTAILGVKMPIPVVNRNQRAILQASSDVARSEAEYRQAVLGARRDLTQAMTAWRSTWTQWQQAKEVRSLSDANLRSLERGFKVGETAAIDLIQQKQRWAEALEAERAALAALTLARVTWEQAQGPETSN